MNEKWYNKEDLEKGRKMKSVKLDNKNNGKELNLDPEDRVNEPNERISGNIEELSGQARDQMSEHFQEVEAENNRLRPFEWAFENPAEAFFISAASIMSRANPKVKDQVIEFVQLPPEKRLEMLVGPEVTSYIKSRVLSQKRD